ncbi:crotonase/enoyl-CoA hydratase family protein [Alcaligenaceae bacterium]|nr:crotonase/enoyl-CoA hydratase family protein [Alcaligenaceae bacterium]
MTENHLLLTETHDTVLVVRLNRAAKRNAINDDLLSALEHQFSHLPEGIRAVVLAAEGDHFCAGLDLAERLSKPRRTALDTVKHSRRWHRCFEQIQFGEVPVISALKGAVVGGGLELAAATHIRVADASTFFQLPEGQHGIFVGGGASVRVPRIIGAHRMVEMMLSGRKIDVTEGHALGLCHYVTDVGGAFDQAMLLATKIAGNAQISNYAIINAISRISDMSMAEGFFTESVVASMSRSSSEADDRIASFFEKKGNAARSQ